ncbi:MULTISPECIES: hypothetical protein [Arthrobacter]|uniref:DUF4386 domain-containing protein n=2 Tax=Arthrobacter TaxID=1663 RepID=A0ABU9KJZ7_9MICC|nr:hypothetical protein [Arthrobacter sp. YJM1]MDP5227102.1 hypothetical protein [Arthrobacter sp. YJM1]
MTQPSNSAETPRRRRPDGPNAGILALISLLLSLAAVLIPLLLSGTRYPAPSDSSAVTADYFISHPFAATLTGTLVFGASVPLGIYAATVNARLLHLGVRVPGTGIAFYGGIAASVLLSVAGLLSWSLGQAAAGVSPRTTHLLNDFVFAVGGVGFVGGLGLLIAGIAVPSLILRLVPRWLAWTGLVLAALSELSFFGLLWPVLDILLPIGRFAGLLWLSVIGFRLPRTRHEVPRRPSDDGRR